LGADQPWITNPEYRALREKTLNVGLRRAGFPEEWQWPGDPELAEFCAATPDRFVALATVALPNPQLLVARRPQQLAGRLKMQHVLVYGTRAVGIEFACNCSVECTDASREVNLSAAI
jgi:hypothetical protein